MRFGAIVASIWSNKGQQGTWYNATFARIYKEGEEWKRADSFGKDDLLTLAKVADLAHTRIHELLKAE